MSDRTKWFNWPTEPYRPGWYETRIGPGRVVYRKWWTGATWKYTNATNSVVSNWPNQWRGKLMP